MKVKMLQGHTENCLAMESVLSGEWSTPWYFTGETTWRDRTGGKRGHGYRWLVLQCNSILSRPCHAKVIIDANEIEDEVQRTVVRSL